MENMLRVKHLIWTIGGMLVFAFGLGMNVNSKLIKIDSNTIKIESIEESHKNSMLIIQRNQSEILRSFSDLRLELKLELKDKKNRE